MGITIIGWLIGIIIGFGGVVIVKRIINANVELGIIIAMITLGLILSTVGIVIGANLEKTYLEKEFVKTQCARYNPTTGDFEIIKEFEVQNGTRKN